MCNIIVSKTMRPKLFTIKNVLRPKKNTCVAKAELYHILRENQVLFGIHKFNELTIINYNI